MKDGELSAEGRPLRAAVRPRAVASGREGLGGGDDAGRAWRHGSRSTSWGSGATGASLRFVFREGEGEPFTGSMVEYTPQSAMELAGRTTRRCGWSWRRRARGCVLTLINRFDEIGKAARDAAGWHACLDALEASLAGASIDAMRVWGEVHPGYVSRFGPEAATIGPPTGEHATSDGFLGLRREQSVSSRRCFRTPGGRARRSAVAVARPARPPAPSRCRGRRPRGPRGR